MYMMTIKPGMKTRKKAAFRVYDDMPAVSFWSYHLSTCGRRAFPAHPEVFRSRTPHGTVSKIQCPRVSDVLLAYDVLPAIYAELAAFWSPFQQRNSVKNFRLHVKKWWWLSPPLLKVVVTCHHRHIQSCAYASVTSAVFMHAWHKMIAAFMRQKSGVCFPCGTFWDKKY